MTASLDDVRAMLRELYPHAPECHRESAARLLEGLDDPDAREAVLDLVAGIEARAIERRGW